MKLNVAVVGLGIGQEHLKAYRQLPHCELYAISDLSEEHSRMIRAQYGLTCKEMTFDQIVEDPQIQIVSIASYDSHHAEQVLRLIEAGKHIFVEKPLCHSSIELKRIVEAWKKAPDIHIQSNLVLRSAPVYQELNRMRVNGRLGSIYSVDAEYLYGRLEKITHGWRKLEPDYSVFAGGAVHMMDLVLSFLGERPNEVTAAGNRIVTEGTDFQFNDYVTALLRFPSGCLSRVTANFGCVHPHQHVLRAFGSRGTFFLDDAGARTFQKRGDDQKALPLNLPTLPPSKSALIPQFVEGVLRRQDPSAAFYREVDLMSVVLAVERAHLTNTVTRVEYLGS